MNFNWLSKLYAWALVYMVAVIVALNMIAALAEYVTPLMVVIVLCIVARVVWWYTRW